ncbi:hypothetical protein [Mucilaginibacter jinjuensis]|uniref:Uncharacterized protein n=1 Tax=Mucilaginibacter jinjuensis TaxID=1176721 RepID=A0ABY7TDX6_9SPHI|nr:hypothetical protein [Mucilaginibacter jinjuensis]WCT14398.1 hypothetical protein PQO05_10685 [Mucilaginibacter jinjuensis]
MAGEAPIYNPGTQEIMSRIPVTTWRDGTVLTSLNDSKYLGAIYGHDSVGYFKYGFSGAYPVSRLSSINQDCFQKLINDLGSTTGYILVDSMITITQNINVPANIILSFTPNSGFNISSGITLVIQSEPICDNQQLFYGAGVAIIQGVTCIQALAFGAKADGIVLKDGATTASSNIFSSNSAVFTNDDINKIIFINGANTGGATLIGYIISIQSANQVTLSINAAVGVAGAVFVYGVDSTYAFININKTARTLGNGAKIVFQKGQGSYLTKFNNWLAGIQCATVEGNGASIMSTYGAYDATATGAAQGLAMPSCYSTFDNNYPLLSTNFFGSKINSINNFTDTVSLISITEISTFNINDWILIYGYDNEQVGGFPPDSRYYEYAQIIATDATLGTIQLDRVIINSYDAAWPENLAQNDYGVPRIISLNRTNFTTIESLTMNDLSFLPFPGWVGTSATAERNGRASFFGYITAQINNVICPACYIGQGKDIELNNFKVSVQCEIDKTIDSVIIRNSQIRGLTQGSINSLKVFNTVLTGPTNSNARSVELSGNYFNSSANGSSSSMIALGGKRIERVQIGTNVWNCVDPSRNSLMNITGSINLPVTSVVGTDTILLSYATWRSGTSARGVSMGAVGFTATGKKIIVTRVYQYDATNVAVIGNFSAPPVAGDLFIFNLTNAVSIDFQRKIGPYSSSVKDVEEASTTVGYRGYRFNSPVFGLRNIFLDQSNIINGANSTISSNNFFPLFGIPIKLIIVVIKAYTGPDVSAHLRITNTTDATGGTKNLLELIDLKTTGLRVIDVGQVVGSRGTDNLVLMDSSYTQMIRVLYSGASLGTITLNDPSDVPIFQLQLETFNYTY